MAKAQETETRTPDQITFDTHFDAGLPASSALLHQALFSQGIPSEKTLQPMKIPGLKMSWTPLGLLLKAPMKNGTIKRIGIAQANVVNFEV